ncbi:MAG TPA: polysaccharide deacetylase family protein [Actinomycetes bacterium]|nr:polysaccharide deacetylase family protein [Actinomycetes bacterium]
MHGRRIVLLVVLASLVAGCQSRQPPVSSPGTVTRPPTSTATPSTTGVSPTTTHGTRPTPTTALPPTTKPPPTTRAALPSALVGTEWTRLPTTRKVVALTFDAGGDAAGVQSILATLASTGTPATFFATGRWVARYPQQARTIAARYPMGNHTQTHPDLTGLSDQAVRDEVTTAQAGILEATGRDPRPLFRFPYGASDRRTIGIVNDLGYGAFRWTIDTLGWKGTSGGQSVATVVGRVLAGLRPGAIVLLHVGANPDDGSTLDADALPTLISQVHGRGYGVVTISTYL